ncbi:hypothetical protein QBC38DRAFT_511797 [Podospora fimiseda]|uniref:Uncharacterized protein n=1 Tax=Podospora fimiseda TaxID=252190 RepID=A0AAN7GTY1_9PEZI|nr:hypothetical protein QBC38DRAFT_511797 [Podospora fimiseda]
MGLETGDGAVSEDEDVGSELVLASIVNPKALSLVKAISDAQAPVDAAQEELNSLLASRRSLDMTNTELLNLGIDTKPIDDELTSLSTSISKAAGTYIEEKVKSAEPIHKARSQISAVHAQMESPVDYVKSQIKSMPLASDSINMDDANSFAANISKYFSASVSRMGDTVASQMSNAASAQVSDQTSKHSIEGTLVISVSCTHKNASILAPFALNFDKAIKTWNHLMPSDQIQPTSTKNMLEIANALPPPEGQVQPHFSIISGMTYGSSFVGIVHILNTSSTPKWFTARDFEAIERVFLMDFFFSNYETIRQLAGNRYIDHVMRNPIRTLLHKTGVTQGVIPACQEDEIFMITI